MNHLYVCERSSISFYLLQKSWLELSRYKFWIVHTNSNGKKWPKQKVVDRDEFYNFVVDDFSVIQTKYDGKMTKTKVVDLN